MQDAGFLMTRLILFVIHVYLVSRFSLSYNGCRTHLVIDDGRSYVVLLLWCIQTCKVLCLKVLLFYSKISVKGFAFEITNTIKFQFSF